MDVRRIEAGEGERLRAIRLAALRDAPDAFRSLPEHEEAYAPELWEQHGRTVVIAQDGDDWLGTAGWTIQALGTTPAGVATLQVTVIVVGHVLGTVLAHDRALTLFPRRTAVLGQIPLLLLMVVYTVMGLLLLFAA